jgi:hypothetical protein
MDHSKDKSMKIRGNVATCPVIYERALGTKGWNIDKQRLYWYFRVLCVCNSISKSITIPIDIPVV